jgi:hypothetical protein
MITQGQATLLQSQIRSYIALALIGSFAAAMALMIWQAAFGQNPLANAMAKTLYSEQGAQQL